MWVRGESQPCPQPGPPPVMVFHLSAEPRALTGQVGSWSDFTGLRGPGSVLGPADIESLRI